MMRDENREIMSLTDALTNKLQKFYERTAKKNTDDEFSIEKLYGKRSSKEIEFLKKFENINRRDIDLVK